MYVDMIGRVGCSPGHLQGRGSIEEEYIVSAYKLLVHSMDSKWWWWYTWSIKFMCLQFSLAAGLEIWYYSYFFFLLVPFFVCLSSRLPIIVVMGVVSVEFVMGTSIWMLNINDYWHDGETHLPWYKYLSLSNTSVLPAIILTWANQDFRFWMFSS